MEIIIVGNGTRSSPPPPIHPPHFSPPHQPPPTSCDLHKTPPLSVVSTCARIMPSPTTDGGLNSAQNFVPLQTMTGEADQASCVTPPSPCPQYVPSLFFLSFLSPPTPYHPHSSRRVVKERGGVRVDSELLCSHFLPVILDFICACLLFLSSASVRACPA